ncbi:hypothetical protein BH09BAC4_BH09BAC4_51510 [soil metagenome]
MALQQVKSSSLRINTCRRGENYTNNLSRNFSSSVSLERVWELLKAERRAIFVSTKLQSHDQIVETTDRSGGLATLSGMQFLLFYDLTGNEPMIYGGLSTVSYGYCVQGATGPPFRFAEW